MPFITVEGIEGSGKSTQVRRLGRGLGERALVTKEPGGTRLGGAIRGLLLDPGSGELVPEAELLLYFADRAQHVRERIRPALAEGRTVLCDRYTDSSFAYQGYGRGLSLEALRQVAAFATGGLRPDVTLFLDIPVETGLMRVRERGGADRLEAEERAFHERVRAGYESLMREDPERWIRVDGNGSPEVVADRVSAALERRGFLEA